MVFARKAGVRLALFSRSVLRFAMRLPPVLILLACLTVTVFFTVLAALSVKRENDTRFNHLADQLTSTIQARMISSENVLLHTRAFFMGQRHVSRSEYHNYVQALDISRRYPGLSEIQYAARVPIKHLDGFEDLMHREGVPDFKVWPDTAGTDEVFSIIFLEPVKPENRRTIGFNSFSNPVWREAMERARDSGEPAISRLLDLPAEQDENPQKGFILYIPVYAADVPPPTLEERQAALLGFVQGVIRANDLFGALVSSFAEKNSIDAEIYDGVVLKPENLLFDSRSPLEEPDATQRVFMREIPLDIGGLHWTVKVHSLPGFEPISARNLPWYVLLAGLMTSFLLYRSSKASEALIAEKQKLLDESRQVNRSKDDFLATLSHELRTPLGVILGHAEILMCSDCPDDVRESVEAIHRNAKVQTRIIDDLLEVSSIITGKLRLDQQPVDVRETIDAATESVLFSAQAKAIHVEISAPERIVVNGDATRLQQVFWNLLTNAVKFTYPGGSIRVSARRRGDSCEVSIADSGQGMDASFLPYVFDRFRQEDGSTTRRFGGLGLGLAIVQNLVHLHGGTVRAYSAGRGHGSEFVVTLPTIETNEVASTPAGAVSRKFNSRLDEMRVLVVDDDTDSRGIAKKTLEQAGARVRAVSSAAEALVEYHSFRPQLIVSDIGMPNHDGYELIREIRDEERRTGGSLTPAIALTAFAQPKDQVDSLRAGFQAHLVKPFATRDLVDTAAQLCAAGHA